MAKASYELPQEILSAIQTRCDDWGITPDELVAAVLLHHLEWDSHKDSPGWGLLDALEKWEHSPRTIACWERLDSRLEDGG